MLYRSTRDVNETYTAHIALTQDKAQDGGRIVPLGIPMMNDYIQSMSEKSFNQIVADVLNQFYSVRLTLWDMDLTIGKSNIRVTSMNHRLMVAEMWHNPVGQFKYVFERLKGRMLPDSQHLQHTSWFRISVWISALFGVYGQLLTEKIVDADVTYDLVIPSDDLVVPVAADIARRMGLPIGTIICSCASEGSLWELIHRGTINTATASENLLSGVETLLFYSAGQLVVDEFVRACESKRSFMIPEEVLERVFGGFYCTVAGCNRAETTINSVFRSNQYIMDPASAVCYSGLQDYRSCTGSGRMTLLMSEEIPLAHTDKISTATGIPVEKIVDYVKL